MGETDDLADLLKDTVEDILGTEAEAEGELKRGKLYKHKQEIVEIIDEVEEHYGAQIPIDDITRLAKKKDIGEEEVHAIVDELVHDGYLERPRWMEGIVQKKGTHLLFCPWHQDLPG